MASHELEMMEKIRIQVGDSNNAVIDNDDCIVFHVTNQLEGGPDSRVNPISQGVSKANMATFQNHSDKQQRPELTGNTHN